MASFSAKKNSNLCKIIENFEYSHYSSFFEKLGNNFKQKIKKYEGANPELYAIGEKACKEFENLSIYFKPDELVKDSGFVSEIAERTCSLNYKTLSIVLDYLRTPLCNYLYAPSRLIMQMWEKSQDSKNPRP